jgi:hypothetical protein
VVVVATDQSKLPEDNGSRSPHKVLGCDGLDQSNYNNGRRRMGGGTTRTALQLQKKTYVDGGRTGTMIKSDRNAMQCDDDFDDNADKVGR